MICSDTIDIEVGVDEKEKGNQSDSDILENGVKDGLIALSYCLGRVKVKEADDGQGQHQHHRLTLGQLNGPPPPPSYHPAHLS